MHAGSMCLSRRAPQHRLAPARRCSHEPACSGNITTATPSLSCSQTAQSNPIMLILTGDRTGARAARAWAAAAARSSLASSTRMQPALARSSASSSARGSAAPPAPPRRSRRARCAVSSRPPYGSRREAGWCRRPSSTSAMSAGRARRHAPSRHASFAGCACEPALTAF
jgi:hypothetical protein